MPRSIFVSHVYEDHSHKETIARWAVQGLLGDAVVSGEAADYRQLGQSAIQTHLHQKLTGAGTVLVLVGNDSHNHPWVDYEVNHALSQNKQVIPVRIPGTSGAGPSSVRGRSPVSMDPSGIIKAIRGW